VYLKVNVNVARHADNWSLNSLDLVAEGAADG